MELSYLIYTFLRAYDDNEVSVKVAGSRRLANGLVVPGTFKARTPSRAIGRGALIRGWALKIFFFLGGGWGGRLFEAGRLLTFPT